MLEVVFSFIVISACAVIVFAYRKNLFGGILKNPYFIIFSLALAVRLLCTMILPGFPGDMACFKAWSNMLYEDGFYNFYRARVFTDYPPLYMYVLYFLGMVRSVFGIEDSSVITILIKSPAIIADVLSCLFVYKLARAKMKGRNAFIVTLFYVLNPFIIYNSSLWGQVDSIHTLIMAVALWMAVEKKLFRCLFLFSMGVLIKPQCFTFSPIFLYFIYTYGKEQKWSDKAYMDIIRSIAACLFVAFLLITPFSVKIGQKIDYMPVIKQYINTLSSYKYISVNAYNIYQLLNLNYRVMDFKVFGIEINKYGILILAVIVIFTFFVMVRSKVKSMYFYAASLITACTFMLSFKMHERYSYPVLLPLLIAYIYKRDKRFLFIFTAFSFTFLMNVMDIMRLALNGYDHALIENTRVIGGALNTGLFVIMLIVTFLAYKKGEKDEPEPEFEGEASFLTKT